MDMWDPYIKAIIETIPEAAQKIAFDRFHVAKFFNEALDKVRRREHAAFMSQTGENLLFAFYGGWQRRQPRTLCAILPKYLKIYIKST